MRASLPTGSTDVTVRKYLRSHGIDSNFDKRSKTIFATIRNVKGSILIVREDPLVKFHFDDTLKLTEIDAKVGYTGP